jgi:hypothetical protein
MTGAKYTCSHCGQPCGDYPGGYSSVTAGSNPPAILCHPNDPMRPDCYRRVTVFHEPLGRLLGMDPQPAGLEGIDSETDVFLAMVALSEELGLYVSDQEDARRPASGDPQ